MEHDVNEEYCLELLRRIITEGDQEARAELQQRWSVISLFWFQLVFSFHLFNYCWDRKTPV